MPEEILETLLDDTAASVGVRAPVTNTVERISGHPGRTFGDWVLTHRADFEGM